MTPRLVDDWFAQETDTIVRARLACSAGLPGVPGSWPGLRAGLDDPSYRVRAASATALGRLRVTAAVELLQRSATADSVPCVRDAAAAALRRMASPEP